MAVIGSDCSWLITQIPRSAIGEIQTVTQDPWQALGFWRARGEVTAERRVLLQPGTVQTWRNLWEGRAPHGKLRA